MVQTCLFDPSVRWQALLLPIIMLLNLGQGPLARYILLASNSGLASAGPTDARLRVP